MNKKYIFLGLILLVLSSFVLADTITQYTLPSDVPLNQKITVTGLYDSNAGKNAVLCSFYFLDDDGKLVYRASDQYTVSSGRFTMLGVTMTEPTFVRGQTYTLHTECGGAVADGNFFVGQKQEAFDFFGYKFYPQGVTMDFLYFNGDNGVMIFGLFIMIFVFIGAVLVALFNFYG